MPVKPQKFEMRVWLDLESATLADIHELRNFGEDLWRSLREERRALINLAEVDASTDKLVVYLRTASQSNRRWIEKLIGSQLKKYKNFESRVRLRFE